VSLDQDINANNQEVKHIKDIINLLSSVPSFDKFDDASEYPECTKFLEMMKEEYCQIENIDIIK